MLNVLDHPLAAHIITHLRDKTTKPATFRTLAYQISMLLAIEATANVETSAKEIETPLERMTGRELAHETLVVVPILRAGLGMVQPFSDLFPDVSVGYIGLERDHATAVARSYYCKLPPLSNRHVFLVDPMLATGGSAVQALTIVKEQGAKNPTLVCIVAAPEGVAEVEKHHPGTPIHTAALDRQLNDRKYILPGLGDFGDRLYGT
ncbi:uracil phosphoribosyltransferase [Opitutus sp. ER46]|uniref:uracil phosphoribosyltransferase n=1 Tax=Opitutus sp. ER46 TaxID=2161864 RepID=UPI000D2F7FE7|nr:uracil phosphoribosyltransferase [Opitutus sp. ER46]PTX91429.1 uracil phosphoribosyltransferase [Opitutus sp. ER46]